MPALYNDEVVCPALEALGIPPVDSHNYCMNGCNQIDIFGKSHMGLEDGEISVCNPRHATLKDRVFNTQHLSYSSSFHNLFSMLFAHC